MCLVSAGEGKIFSINRRIHIFLDDFAINGAAVIPSNIHSSVSPCLLISAHTWTLIGFG